MELLVVGSGAIGRWFGGVVTADHAYADVDPGAARAAAEQTGGRAVTIDSDEPFEAVAIAVPIPAATAAIAEHASRASEAVLDLTGTMTEPVGALTAHAASLERVSLHPLFAPENAPGRIAAVTVEGGPVTDSLRADLEAAGNELFETTPEAHDHAMETVQAKAHAAVLAFAIAAEDVDPAFGTPVYEKLSALASEVAGGEPRVYADIQAAFDGAEEVAEAARAIADADRAGFERVFRDLGG